jgi:hypothetical protein
VARKVFSVLPMIVASAVLAMAQIAEPAPQLLLNAQRLHRLKRDRDRKTVRWVNFENRINTVPDSPERGFELALYYAITGDEAKGREAVQWALTHNSPRQSALVLDWCAALISDDQKKKLSFFHFISNGQPTYELARDLWFNQVASGRDPAVPNEQILRDPFNSFMLGRFNRPEDLYALCELIYAVRAKTHTDLRDTDPHFFATLPSILLLSAKPRGLNSPDWLKHVAALALVAIDPNLPASQFLQSWALENSQTLREGPGVAYELLWADPYLPGVGYQNMDTWSYDDHGLLFARSNWEPNSCWIEISSQAVDQENCPPHWQIETVTFGHLTLIPMTERCIEIPRVANNEAVLIWKLKANQKMIYGKGKDQRTSEADAAGIWRPSAYVESKACVAPH